VKIVEKFSIFMASAAVAVAAAGTAAAAAQHHVFDIKFNAPTQNVSSVLVASGVSGSGELSAQLSTAKLMRPI